MKKAKKKYFSVSEVWEIVNKLDAKTQRLPELLGFRSGDIGKGYKKLITLCNSLSILFLQYDLLQDALKMLKKASDADTGLQRFGMSADKSWHGSLITYNTLALFFHKVGHYQESLKLLFQAQNCMIKIKESGASLVSDVSISVNMLTFVALWKIKRFKEATAYLETAGQSLNAVIRKEKITKMSSLSTQNVYGLILMGLAALKAVSEGNVTQAIQLCIDGVDQFDDSVVVRGLLDKLLKFLSKTHETDLNKKNNSFNFTLLNLKESSDDWLITKEFEKILFLTTFLPLIGPNTPLIRESELVSEREVHNGTESEENLEAESISNSELTQTEEKPYLTLIKNVMAKKNLNQLQPVSRKNSRKAAQSTPKRRAGSPKHWWESKKILSNILNDSSNAQIDNPKPPRYRSEPRTREVKNVPKTTSVISTLKSNRLMPLNSNMASPNISNYKLPSRNPRELIMLEFNPTFDASGNSVPVELIPLGNYQNKSPRDIKLRASSLLDHMGISDNICD